MRSRAGIIISINLIAVLLMTACGKQENISKDPRYRSYIHDNIKKSYYYSSGFAKEGNDYYNINLMKETDYNFESYIFDVSVPSRYILGIDAEYKSLNSNRKYVDEIIEYVPEADINKITLNMYDIGSNELVDSMDIKDILQSYENDRTYVRYINISSLKVNEQPCIRFDAYEKPCSLSEFKNPKGRVLYIDLINKKVIKEKSLDEVNELESGKIKDIKIFDHGSTFSQDGCFVTKELYWKETVLITFFIHMDDFNNKYTKLYEKFPDLEEQLDELKKRKQDVFLNVVLTQNPTYEEIAELITEEGEDISFDEVFIDAEDSVDGLEHQIYSFDDWRKYYKVNEADTYMVSPIFPRKTKE